MQNNLHKYIHNFYIYCKSFPLPAVWPAVSAESRARRGKYWGEAGEYWDEMREYADKAWGIRGLGCRILERA